MKKTDLEKLKGVSITARMKQADVPGRFGSDAHAVSNRREQRRLDQARGLVPFAVKLDGELVKQIHALAQQRNTGLNELVGDLLKKALAG